MTNGFVFLERVHVLDNKVYTKQRVREWRNHMLDSYEDVFNAIKPMIDFSFPLDFFYDRALADEVIIDAIIGLKKITGSTIHSVNSPNAFKIAAYLSYWWMRHKPISIHYPLGYDLRNIEIAEGYYEDENGYYESKDIEQKKIVWRLKHINELIAVQMVASYVFNFENTICDNGDCARIKKADENYCFNDFVDMKETILQKLLYYFAYRPITPKVIEHILEGYTFHPAWGLTGCLWSPETREATI